MACLLALGLAMSARAAGGGLHLRRHTPGVADVRSATEPHWACPEGPCEAIVAPRPDRVGEHFALPGSVHLFEGGGELGGFDPADLQSAYKIPAGLESQQTVALVDAYGYPNAEADLSAYRSRYGLTACTTADGCFRKVNVKGEEGNYPAESEGWDQEAALDEDMASAACPECHILMVEASSQTAAALSAAVNEAAKLGATEISNSYGLDESFDEECGTTGCAQYAKDFVHAGVLITASSGDAGYEDVYERSEGLPAGVNWPASLPGVVAVGGTALYKDTGASRGWSEEVWNEPSREIASGSGCSKFEAKPAWQTESGCAKRIDNDVAAVAAVLTGVSVRIDGEWEIYGGTSVAAPLVAGIEAHAGAYVRALGPQAFYEQPGSLFDVTSGFDGVSSDECSPSPYLCNAEVGFDGPTGFGTPDGVPSSAGAPVPTVTKVAPGEGSTKGSSKVTITGTNFTGSSEVKFGALKAKSFKVISATSISAVSPADSTAGPVNVTVKNLAGTSATSPADVFTYVAIPTVTGVTPDEGPTSGGTKVTITGTSFSGVTKVTFGKVKAKSFTVLSPSEIVAETGADPAGGAVNVTIAAAGGTSAVSTGDRFTYVT